MELIGHRGCADLYPENTVTAITETARHLDVVEVDVRRCGSGELVVFHDDRVDDLTDGTGRVANLDWSELRSLEVLGAGESIPLLSTVLDVLPADVRLQIELKERGLTADVHSAVTAANGGATAADDRAGTGNGSPPDSERTRQDRDVAADGGVDAAGRGRTDGSLDVVVTSFKPSALATVEDLEWAVPTGYLFEASPMKNLRTAIDLNCDAVHPHYDCCLETDIVANAHRRGLDVVAWKAAKTTADVDALRAAGVDGVTSDRWDIA